MATTAADHSEAKEKPEAKDNSGKNISPHHSVDRFADARRAKRKAKRLKHRAKLKRSHTKG